MAAAGMPLEIEVAFTPCAGRRDRPAVHVLIDVVRATTAMVSLVELGARRVVLAADDATARAARDMHPDALLCAESDDGCAAPGADFAPSLAGLPHARVSGRPVILRSTNGTVAALEICGRPGVGLVGSLRNATAAMRVAVALAYSMSASIRLVCAGRDRTASFCLDDAYCAGVLVDRALAAAKTQGVPARLRDSASVARELVDRYPDAYAALAASESAAVLRRIGCDDDIAIAATVDVSTAVPALAPAARGRQVDLIPIPKFATIAPEGTAP